MSSSEDVKFTNVRGLYLRKYGTLILPNRSIERNKHAGINKTEKNKENLRIFPQYM